MRHFQLFTKLSRFYFALSLCTLAGISLASASTVQGDGVQAQQPDTFMPDTSISATNDAVACLSGRDLLVEKIKEQPDFMQEIEKEAAKIPNHKGLLWKVVKDDSAPSFIYGTFHLSDPRVTNLPPAVQEAYDQSQTVVIETTDLMDPKNLVTLMVEKPDLMRFTDGTTIMSLLPGAKKNEIEERLAKRGIALSALNKYRPWMIYSMLVLPSCETKRKAAQMDILDQKLAKTALEKGKALVGLETMAEQIEAMNRIPMDFHIKSLVSAVDFMDDADDIMETMIGMYLKQNIGEIVPALNMLLPDYMDEEGYGSFEQIILTERNHLMAERAAPLLAKGNHFMAVGAMHLPGEDGVLELLKKDGFTIENVSYE